MKKAAKKEARRLAREERKAQEAERLRRAHRSRTAVIGVIAVVVAIVIGFAVWTSLRPRGSPTGGATPGQAAQSNQSPSAQSNQPTRPAIADFPQQSRDHILPGQAHPPYSSNPPSSGWHYATPADWGFYTQVLQDEQVVHNLEHGGIWISYKDANDSAVVDPLVALAREFPHKVIITFRPKNDSRLAVVAWEHVMKLDAYNRDAIVDFIKRFKDKGPEFVPD